MKPTPHRDQQEWACYTARFSALLTWLPVVCFWVVVAGSVYGIQKSIEAQHAGVGIPIAAIAAFIIQTLNRVSVHFSTRWISSWFFIGANRQRYLSANTHQKIKYIDGVVGFLCLLFTASICYFDFRANREASEIAAVSLVARPDSLTVNTEANAPAIRAAQLAVTSAQQAEQSERLAFEANVDKQINTQRAKYTNRQTHLANLKNRPTWATNELKNIDTQLRALENTRRARKAEYIPSGKVAEAQNSLAAVSSQASRQLLANQTHADTTNQQRALTYESKKESYSMAMFWLYITAMLLWHLCHAMKAYRALRYDEQHPSAENPLIAIAQTIVNGFSNLLWIGHAKILYWMPEEEIHGISRPDLLDQTDTPICRDVYNHIHQNPGINELVIYTNLRQRYEIEKIRNALRLLKTAKLIFENAHAWTAAPDQAHFFSTQNIPQPATIFNAATLTPNFP